MKGKEIKYDSLEIYDTLDVQLMSQNILGVCFFFRR